MQFHWIEILLSESSQMFLFALKSMKYVKIIK